MINRMTKLPDRQRITGEAVLHRMWITRGYLKFKDCDGRTISLRGIPTGETHSSNLICAPDHRMQYTDENGVAYQLGSEPIDGYDDAPDKAIEIVGDSLCINYKKQLYKLTSPE